MLFLGFNATEHDSGAALVDESGQLLAAVQEERFSRVKKEGRWPAESIRYCLSATGAKTPDLGGIAYGWSRRHFVVGRLLRSHLIDYPVGPKTYMLNVGRFLDMVNLRRRFESEIGRLERACVWRSYRHHLAHAASAYFSSPFDEAAFLTVDGRGERESTTWGIGRASQLHQMGAFFFPHSIGKLYSALCRFLGFASPEKDGTVMALAALGTPRFLSEFEELIQYRDGPRFGRITLNTEYFDLRDVAQPSVRLERLLGTHRRQPEQELNEVHCDIAATLQHVTQDLLVCLTSRLREVTKMRCLVMAGGVALNTVANAHILERSGFEELFVQPAAHDGGLALGAAQLLAAQGKKQKPTWSMRSAATGPAYDDIGVGAAVQEYSQMTSTTCEDVASVAANRIAHGEVVAWFQGRLEFGPRALGNRSLLADPRDGSAKTRLNNLKGREPFRPFAAAILAEQAQLWLQRGTRSPFMLFIDHVRSELKDRVPAILHVDGSVRIQTVERDTDPLFHRVISAFFELTGVPMVVNTSLNVRGEPLARTPVDALRLLAETNVQTLFIGPYKVTKTRAAPRKASTA